MNKVNLAFDILEARFLLEACRAYEEYLLDRAQSTSDEDEEADLSNDSGYVACLHAYIKTATEEALGSEATSFSRPPTF